MINPELGFMVCAAVYFATFPVEWLMRHARDAVQP